MSTLDYLIRRRVARSYYPFSQPSYRGTYPLGSARRVSPWITNTPSILRLLVTKTVLSSPKSSLNLYEDRRLYHPEGKYRPAVSLVESYPTLTETSPNPLRHKPRRIGGDLVNPTSGEILSFGAFDPFKISWSNPWKMAICLKRKMRREVMHALGMAGKTGFKKPKFTQYSYVKCF